MDYIDNLKRALDNTTINGDNGKVYQYSEGIRLLYNEFSDIKSQRRAVFICGNGGSAGIAVHMTADFLKNGGFNVRSLFNPSVLTCLGNDLSYHYIFSEQIRLMASKGDVLVAISSSGESDNIIRTADLMTTIGGEVITFTGFRADNQLKAMGKYNVYVPIEHYGIVESIHNLILQQLVDMIVKRDGVALQVERV